MTGEPVIQLSLADADETGEYRAFVQKFKPKKTTDDCVTPPEVYEAVADWVAAEYGVDRADFVRPFWPGEDYTRHRYAGRIVVDNPPFSIISRIVKFYARNGIRFFLFAPALTLFSCAAKEEVCALAVGVKIRYENGAEVPTSFLTNMDAAKVRTAPGLYKAVADAVERGRKKKPELPVYDLPDNVITAARIMKYAHYGIEFTVPRGQAHFVRSIGAMGDKGLFGAGFLISDKAAADKAAADKAAADKAAADKAAERKAIRYKLNAREREIVRMLGEDHHDDRGSGEGRAAESAGDIRRPDERADAVRKDRGAPEDVSAPVGRGAGCGGGLRAGAAAHERGADGDGRAAGEGADRGGRGDRGLPAVPVRAEDAGGKAGDDLRRSKERCL